MGLKYFDIRFRVTGGDVITIGICYSLQTTLFVLANSTEQISVFCKPS